MRLKVKYLFPNIPELVSREGDSGYDIRAAIDKQIDMQPMERVSIPTGIMVEIDAYPACIAECQIFALPTPIAIPVHYELQVRPRSGMTKRGIFAQFGTIDESYRGEIWVTLINTSQEVQTIMPLDRIAQLVVCPIFKPAVITAKELTPTVRGANGFGSTGRN